MLILKTFKMNKRFVHVVNFWLKKGLSANQVRQFEEGVHSLGNISTVRFFHLGKPASTNRPVIDSSYDYCLVCAFDNQSDHDAYQTDTIHNLFRETCSHLWDKILIYDSVTT
jgi:Stress responsive A/B Barrel Domain